MRRFLSLILAVLVLAATAACGAEETNGTAIPRSQSGVAAPTVQPSAPAASLPTVAVHHESLEETTERLEKRVIYPVFTSADKELEDFLKTAVTDAILAECRLDELEPEIYASFPGEKDTVAADFEYSFPFEGYLQVAVEMYKRPLAANGNFYTYSSFLVDLENKKTLKLFDLFNAQRTDVERKLNVLVNNDLLSRGEENGIYNTAELTGDECFNVSEEGLTVIFQPYEVASGAAGRIDVMLKWSDILFENVFQ